MKGGWIDTVQNRFRYRPGEFLSRSWWPAGTLGVVNGAGGDASKLHVFLPVA